MSLAVDPSPQKGGAFRGAIVAAILYGALAACLIAVGIRSGGEGQIGVMVWLVLSGLPLTLFGLAFDHARVSDLVVIAAIGEVQWVVVGALIGHWLARRFAKRSRVSREVSP